MEIPNTYKFQLYGKNPKASESFGIVSKSKEPYVSIHKWYLGSDNYPYTYINGGRIPLHRYIWYLNTGVWTNETVKANGLTQKLYVDHINRDKLDARDENLRLSTPAENSYNKTVLARSTDPITGEQLRNIKLKKSGYEVAINKDGQTYKIDQIKSLEEAKSLYNMIASDLFGEFAVLYKDPGSN